MKLQDHFNQLKDFAYFERDERLLMEKEFRKRIIALEEFKDKFELFLVPQILTISITIFVLSAFPLAKFFVWYYRLFF